MPRITPLAFLLFSTLASSVAAQTATYTTFGTGCGGAAGSACISVNWTKNTNTITTGANYAFQINPGSIPLLVCGAEFYSQAIGTAAPVAVSIYDKSSFARPGKALTTATMRLELKLQTHRVHFPQQILLKANTDYFLGFSTTARLRLPKDPRGTSTPFFKDGPGWQGPYKSGWSFRVLCCGGGRAPALSGNGLPKLGQNFGIDLSNAPVDSTALLAFGVKRASFDLGIAGAPGCTLLTQPLIVVPLKTSAVGTATTWLFVPNDTKLIGAPFVNQFAVSAPRVNNMKLVFSNGGDARIGK